MPEVRQIAQRKGNIYFTIVGCLMFMFTFSSPQQSHFQYYFATFCIKRDCIKVSTRSFLRKVSRGVVLYKPPENIRIVSFYLHTDVNCFVDSACVLWTHVPLMWDVHCCVPGHSMNHFNILRKAVVKAYPQRTCDFHTTEAGRLYKQIKNRKDESSLDDAVEAELKKLCEEATKRKAESLLYFVRVAESNPPKQKGTGSVAQQKTAADRS